MTLLLVAAVFVGNQACRPCHAALVAQYERTPMARSTGPVSERVPPGGFTHPASGFDYTITRDGRVTIRQGASKQERRFDFVIGSGAAGSSFIEKRGDLLFLAPITWYAQKKIWDASPGYQDDSAMEWDRPIEPSCLGCHASMVTPVFGTLNRYVDPPFRQAGVACERCHGAGSEHVAGKARMVLPTKLDAERRDDVCRQCHLLSEARIPREGHVFGEYRAGQRLGDLVAYFVFDDPQGPALRSTSHLEKLLASQCKKSSGDNLWCGTCHDIHAKPASVAKSFRQKCLSCHSPDPCKRGPDCVSCHMPKSRAVDAGHGAFTDHSIPRRPGAASYSKQDRLWRLRPFSAADGGDRELGLAYAELYRRTRDERQRAEAERLLKLIR